MRLISLLSVLLFTASCSQKKGTTDRGHDHHITPVVGKPSVMLNDTQIKLANIKVQAVTSKGMGETISLNARLTANEERSETISTRATGRIEKLHIKETGRSVRKGEPLYELYSEQLLTLQQEYLLAKDQFEKLGQTEKRYLAYLKSSERKLLLYGLTQNQINKLGQAKDIQPKITFLSPIDGIVTGINAAEGQYVNEGSLLYRIEDITQLWLEAEVYPQELALVHVGDQVTVLIDGNDQTEARVNFISPEYRTGSQISILRASLRNPQGKWKPGMQAQVLFTHSSKQALSVNTDAVIHHGDEKYVFVQTDKNTFEPRRVETGLGDVTQIEIIEGLKEGESIAVSGAYLLYSDFILKRGSI